jgi:chromosome segregation ATPase
MSKPQSFSDFWKRITWKQIAIVVVFVAGLGGLAYVQSQKPQRAMQNDLSGASQPVPESVDRAADNEPEVADLKAELSSTTEAKRELESKVEEATSEIAQLKKALEEKEAALTKAQDRTELDAAKKARDEMQGNLDKANSEVAQLKKQLEESRAANEAWEELQGNLKKTNSELEQLRKDLADEEEPQ